MEKGERRCYGCGQILRLENKSEYKIKINKHRNKYFCNRCYTNREEKRIEDIIKENMRNL